ncbi:MAG: hypothetical protein BWY83_00005 [bacterium ADurb.Bin478]|nr:MAG: hypothetical protein BWY83_00005 [bacterium ADurb.Bin478]
MQFSATISRPITPPARLNLIVEGALNGLADAQEREELRLTAHTVANATWQRWQSGRPPQDNGQDHEWIVFAHVLKIAESEGLSLAEKRIAAAFAFVHDNYYIPRIMEEEIRECERAGLHDKAAELSMKKTRQRIEHMQHGAVHADTLLRELARSDHPDSPLFTADEISRCVELVSEHDLWKTNPPAPPPTADRLAVSCVEGDALWPLHPTGVLADLQRLAAGGERVDLTDPLVWRRQLQQSLHTLIEFRPKWVEKAAIAEADFIDNESIFRTVTGQQLFREWRTFWSL